LLINTNNLREK